MMNTSFQKFKKNMQQEKRTNIKKNSIHIVGIFSLILVFQIFYIYPLKGAMNLFNWRSYTSLLSVNDFTLGSNMKIYAATGGGLLIYDLKTEKFSVINSLNGIWDNDLNAVTYLQNSNVAVTGSSTGVLVLVDNDLKTSVLLDIQKSTFTNKSVNEFSVQGDTLFISTGFGLVVYNLKEKIFTETVLKFGNFTANTASNKSIIYNNKIFLATNEGLAFAEIDAQIADPKSWTTAFDSKDLNKIPMLDIIEFDGKIYCSSQNSLYRLENDSLIKVLDAEYPIINLTKNKDKVYYCSYSNLYDLNKTPITIAPSFYVKFFKYFDINSSESLYNSKYPLLIYQDYGLAYFSNEQIMDLMPNSPISNKFANLNIGNNGQLIASTGKNGSKGIMIYDGKNWVNYYTKKYSGMITDGIKYTMQSKDGDYYLSGYGGGLIEINTKEATPKFTQYSYLNSPLKGVDTEDWVIIGQVKQSSDGLIWMVNYGENSPGPVLVAMDENKSFYSFENCTNSNYRYYFPLEIDQSNTKWMGSSASGGLYYFNENNTLDKTSDDICGSLVTSSYPNMPGNEITCIKMDKSGILWFGTPYGLASIYNPSAIIYNQKPIVRSIKSLAQQVINDIYVDAVDNKWIATNEGIWVFNSDGSEVLDILDKTNTPIPTNMINSISGDENSGTIYIGTDLGLYAVSTLYVKPSNTYDLKCYPQPFIISKDKELVIDGLAGNSEVFITSITGELIRRFSTFSKRIIWDGLDEMGNKVKSGIYLVSGQSRTGNQSAVQKIAVINN